MSLHLSPETEQVKAKLHTNWNDLLNHARQLERERDEAREALMKIEDLFIDGTDIYADREKMGTIAKEALEEAK